MTVEIFSGKLLVNLLTSKKDKKIEFKVTLFQFIDQ